jgi:Tfp pilus assembly protein PilF
MRHRPIFLFAKPIAVVLSLVITLAIWRGAFDKNPQLTDLGLNLARGWCAAGDGDAARQVVQRALQHNPDASAARQLLSELNSEASCRAR